MVQFETRFTKPTDDLQVYEIADIVRKKPEMKLVHIDGKPYGELIIKDSDFSETVVRIDTEEMIQLINYLAGF